MNGSIQVTVIVSPFIPLMLVGTVLSGLDRGSIARPMAVVLVPVLSLLVVVLLSISPILHVGWRYRLSLVTATGLFVLVWRFGRAWKPSRVLDAAASISFPLYVVHAVVGYALLARLLAHSVPAGLAFVLAVLAGATAATVLHFAVEKPTHRLGRRWARRFGYATARVAEPASPAVEVGAGEPPAS